MAESKSGGYTLVKGSSVRRAAWPIERLFVDRWSSRSMTGEPIEESELMLVLEAARWAPSSHNFQPWRFLYARRGTPHYQTFFELLFDVNSRWAHTAGALIVVVSKTHDGEKPHDTHSLEAGCATQNLALQASLLGLAVHGIRGFDRDRARTALAVPAEYFVDEMIVLGRPDDPARLPDELRAREKPSDRRPLAQLACEGKWAL